MLLGPGGALCTCSYHLEAIQISGGVSRVEVTLYVHAASHLMAIQTTQPSTQVGGRRFSMVFQRKLADCVFGGCPVAPQPVIYT
jgi:hypothetical protein